MKKALPFLLIAVLAFWCAGFADNDAKTIADLQARVKVLEKVNEVNTDTLDTLDKLNIVDTHLTTAINAHTEAIKAILRK